MNPQQHAPFEEDPLERLSSVYSCSKNTSKDMLVERCVPEALNPKLGSELLC